MLGQFPACRPAIGLGVRPFTVALTRSCGSRTLRSAGQFDQGQEKQDHGEDSWDESQPEFAGNHDQRNQEQNSCQRRQGCEELFIRLPGRRRFYGRGYGVGKRRINAGDDDRRVIGTTSQVGEVDQKASCFGWREDREHGSDFLIAHLAGESVAAKQVRVARKHRKGPLEIDLDFRVWSQRSRDHVFGDFAQVLFVGDAAGRSHFPDQAVVEGKLFKAIVAKAVDATVAHVRGERAIGRERQGRASRPHMMKFFVRLTLAMDLGVGVDNRSLEPLGGSAVAEFTEQQGNLVDGQFASEFTRGVCPHPVSHNEEVPAFAPLVGILSQRHAEVVLVVRAAHPEVALGGDGQNLFPLDVAVAHSRCRFSWLIFPDIEQSYPSASG